MITVTGAKSVAIKMDAASGSEEPVTALKPSSEAPSKHWLSDRNDASTASDPLSAYNNRKGKAREELQRRLDCIDWTPYQEVM